MARKNRNDYAREREKFARTAQNRLFVKVRSMQQRLYSVYQEIINALDIDSDKRIVKSVPNYTKGRRIQSVTNSFNDTENKAFLGWTFRRLLDLFDLNIKYFGRVRGANPESSRDRVRRLIMHRYGYDVARDRIIRNGYLSGLASSDIIALQVSRLIDNAISNRVPLNQFRKAFKDVFINPTGLGITEAHYYRFTHDLFMEFDREAGIDIAKETGVRHAIYAGTRKDNTRPFCLERINRVYTIEEIESWNKLDWQGKKHGVDVKIALGGFNCRHILNWIDENTANEIVKRRGQSINSFN